MLKSITISRLHNQKITLNTSLRRIKMITPIKTPNITSINQGALMRLYLNKTATKNMTRLKKSKSKIPNIKRRMIINGPKTIQTRNKILITIKRSQTKLLPLNLLKPPTIPQQNMRKSHRRRSTKNPKKIRRTLPQRKKKRQSPTMINMSMSQNNRIHTTLNPLQ
ncbi:MAG: hypothetical protein QXS27_00575 [Candidatus Jordarchaeaceae archaeon]